MKTRYGLILELQKEIAQCNEKLKLTTLSEQQRKVTFSKKKKAIAALKTLSNKK